MASLRSNATRGALAAFVFMSAHAHADSLVLANYGGAWANLLKTVCGDPFSKATGVTVTQASTGDSLAQIRVQQTTGNVLWDISPTEGASLPVAERNKWRCQSTGRSSIPTTSCRRSRVSPMPLARSPIPPPSATAPTRFRREKPSTAGAKPVCLVIPMSVSETSYLKFPPTGFTLKWFASFFESPAWISATMRSVTIGSWASLLATVLGTMTAYALRRSTRWDRLLGGAFLSPQVVPVIIVALGVMLVFNRFHLYGSMTGIVMAHAMLALPFVVINVASALRQRGETLALAARVMGAGPLRAFWHVTLPSLRASIVTSAIFAFFVSFDELVVALFIMGRNETLPMRIWANVRDDLTPVVAAVATLLILVTVLAVLLSEWVLHRPARDRQPG
ncbi:ABC transporter permease subunit [Caballeronia sp. GAFFF2]|nr:ABC transporter permease subunit [Caballeronia sp. GAFFF2]